MLNKKSIFDAIEHNEIIIEPFHDMYLNEGYYELHLSNSFCKIKDEIEIIDPLNKSQEILSHSEVAESKIIEPNEFIIGKTVEIICLSVNFAARIDGKGSIAKLGLFIHCSSSHINPGDKVQLTLELYNAGPKAIRLSSGMKIAQIAFFNTK